MIHIHKYLSLALVVVFGLFNVGVPIVIASCPMAETAQGNLCFVCIDPDESGTVRITTEKDSSCCATVVVAERNTTAFVPAKAGSVDVSMSAAVVHAQAYTEIATRFPLYTIAVVSPSPPWCGDIPVFTSSLLI